MINGSRMERREKALRIWEEVIRLIPTDVHVRAAVVDVIPEANEIAEELCEHLRAWQNFPKASNSQVFFGDQ
jgi:hypothetical protein